MDFKIIGDKRYDKVVISAVKKYKGEFNNKIAKV